MKRTKFIFKESYQQAIDLIDDAATKAELMLAITDYGINGNLYQGENKIVKIAMALIMPQIDRENSRYEIKNDAAQSDITHSDPKDLKDLKDPKDPKDLKDLKDLNDSNDLNSPDPSPDPPAPVAEQTDDVYERWGNSDCSAGRNEYYRRKELGRYY